MDIAAIIDAIVSHALASGYFDRVNQHEPKSAPGNGVSASVWADSIEPASHGSGLSTTSARVVFNVRIYTSMVQEPMDSIDTNIMLAVSALMSAYSGDFELGGNVRQIDLLGSSGMPLQARAGYVEQDKRLYRVFTINLPVIVNDAWTQAA